MFCIASKPFRDAGFTNRLHHYIRWVGNRFRHAREELLKTVFVLPGTPTCSAKWKLGLGPIWIFTLTDIGIFQGVSMSFVPFRIGLVFRNLKC